MVILSGGVCILIYQRNYARDYVAPMIRDAISEREKKPTDHMWSWWYINKHFLKDSAVAIEDRWPLARLIWRE